LIPKKNITEKDKEGKLIDKPEIEILGEKKIKLDNQIQTLDQEIRTGKSRTEKAQSIYKSYKYLKRKRNGWQTHLTTNISTKTYNYQNLSDNFRNDGAY
ncbi:24588_t:CDS:1, partial [Racocetra persica]